MARYYAYDMANGKTYIGKQKEAPASPFIHLEQVIVADTLTSSLRGNQNTRNIKEDYIELYKGAIKNKDFKLSPCWLQKEQKDNQNRITGLIAIWYLGEDIIKKEGKE